MKAFLTQIHWPYVRSSAEPNLQPGVGDDLRFLIVHLDDRYVEIERNALFVPRDRDQPQQIRPVFTAVVHVLNAAGLELLVSESVHLRHFGSDIAENRLLDDAIL